MEARAGRTNGKKLWRSISTTLCLVAVSLIPADPAGAGELGGVTMADSATVGETKVVLNGMGLRKKAIFKVYVAGLYLTSRSSDPTAILNGDSARRLDMEFVRTVGKDSLASAWSDCLKANSPQADSETRKSFADLSSWMQDVKSGDRLSFSYEPGQGVEVKVKGKTAGRMSGKGSADALFRCWIGDVPPSADFKAGLLGS